MPPRHAVSPFCLPPAIRYTCRYTDRMTTTVAFRLDDALNNQLVLEAQRSGQTRTDVITRALSSYLYRMACERDAQIYLASPLTDEELAMCAVLESDSTDWSEFFE